ncbi:MAG: hypothetical protein LBH79_07400 [Nitrososphaerota archaeon]|nr:hypothetical protein [Nitrososphaerota archaeon]
MCRACCIDATSTQVFSSGGDTDALKTKSPSIKLQINKNTTIKPTAQHTFLMLQ